MHVVWARTDLDAMKMISDSRNYEAHQRASQRMELEFGQDFVPGKHAKRDREQQPEFPRQELTQDEDQQQKRTGLKVKNRKAEIATLHAAADTAQAFKAALEDAGYLLAKGEKGYIVVDEAGGHSVLSRNIGLKKKEVDAFMAGIELDKLPTIEEAKALQKEARQRQKSKAAEAQKPAPEAAKPEAKPVEKAPETPAPIDLALYAPKPASKFLAPELAQKIEPPLPAQAPQAAQPFDYTRYAPDRTKGYVSKFLPPELAQSVEPSAPAPVQVPPGAPPVDLTLYAPKPKAEEPSPAPQAPQPQPAPPDAALEALKKAIVERQAEDARNWAEDNANQLQRLENTLTTVNAGKAKDFEAIQTGERAALKRRHQNEQRTGIKGFLDAVQGKVNPTLAAGKAEEQRREVEQLQARQVRERKDYLALIAQTKQLEIENLRDRLALQRSEREGQQEEETERYIREYHEAKRIADDLEAQRIHEEIEKNDSLREGPPPPRLGK